MDPTCGWRAGALLCSNTIPVTAANPTFVCTNPFGSAIYEILADLPEPCFQE